MVVELTSARVITAYLQDCLLILLPIHDEICSMQPQVLARLQRTIDGFPWISRFHQPIDTTAPI